MFGIRVNSLIRAVVVMFFVGTVFEFATTDAEARAGRGRSSGRSSSYGSKQSPQSQQRAASNYGNQNIAANSSAGNRGGFMRNMAGGIAGGFLGSMLFSSMGQAAGGVGGAGGSGGMGLLEIALLAGLAYFGFKWWKNRQQLAPVYGGSTQRHSNYSPVRDLSSHTRAIDIGQIRAPIPAGIDSDTASDIFFKIQGAWTRRDLSSVRNLIEREMQDTLEQDLKELKENGQINRLENISVRLTEVIDSWQEDETEYSTVRFTANLLDYTTDENTGEIVEGSDVLPVKFDEKWTFVKPQSANWQLSGIHQV